VAYVNIGLSPTIDGKPPVHLANQKLTPSRHKDYLEALPEGKPKGTIVLIHGFPDTSLGWRYQIPHFVKLGYRTIALDCMGYGKTVRSPKMNHPHPATTSNTATPSGLLSQSKRLRLPRPRQRHRRPCPPTQRPPTHPRRPRLGRRYRLPRRPMVPQPHLRRLRRRHALQFYLQNLCLHGGFGERQTAEFRLPVAVGQRGWGYGGVYWEG